jgi:hypothetical protein
MPDEHLQPNRGWTLLRDAGQFTPVEIDHIEKCRECADWLTLFSDLALSPDVEFDVDSHFILEVDRHLDPERGVALIRNGGKLGVAEQGHLLRCCLCNNWLASLASLARKAGFVVGFEVPHLHTST